MQKPRFAAGESPFDWMDKDVEGRLLHCRDAIIKGGEIHWKVITVGLGAPQRQYFSSQLELAVALACNDLFD